MGRFLQHWKWHNTAHGLEALISLLMSEPEMGNLRPALRGMEGKRPQKGELEMETKPTLCFLV